MLATILTAIIWIPLGKAQGQAKWWSTLYRLSSEETKASEGHLVADQYGYVHIFWSEELSDKSSLIQYTRYDGENWTTPIDIQITETFHTIANLSPVVDQIGILHLIWTDELSGHIYYSQAPAHNATSAQSWSRPLMINFLAETAKLGVDAKGNFHLLYVDSGKEAGVYYARSTDEGITWTIPRWLDPDILPNHIPAWLQFALDKQNGLHAVWSYAAGSGSDGDWVRYFHSLDGGNTWSSFTIDKNEAGSEHLDTFAGPILTNQGNNVHVIWAAGEQLYRHHRFSKDRGRTWSVPTQVFGSLNGQAGDGIAVDGAERLHYFAQIRYPQAIYHAIWDQDHWIAPTIVYLIRNSAFDPIGDQVGAHATHPAIRAGNQLVLTFADSPADPARRLFFMHRILEGVPQINLIPTPTSMPTPQPSPTPTQPSPTATIINLSQVRNANSRLDKVPSPGEALWIGVVPSMILIIGILSYNRLSRRRH